MKEADQLRAYMDKEPIAIIGGVGGCHEILRLVLDRFGEMEWMIGVMRGIELPASCDTHNPGNTEG